jgi:hypothetical protein
MSKRRIRDNKNKSIPNCAVSERRVERCVTLTWRPDVSRPGKTTR